MARYQELTGREVDVEALAPAPCAVHAEQRSWCLACIATAPVLCTACSAIANTCEDCGHIDVPIKCIAAIAYLMALRESPGLDWERFREEMTPEILREAIAGQAEREEWGNG